MKQAVADVQELAAHFVSACDIPVSTQDGVRVQQIVELKLAENLSVHEPRSIIPPHRMKCF